MGYSSPHVDICHTNAFAVLEDNGKENVDPSKVPERGKKKKKASPAGGGKAKANKYK